MQVVLKNGQELEAEVVIAGIGVEPTTEYLENSGVELNSRKYISVNEVGDLNRYFFRTFAQPCFFKIFFVVNEMTQHANKIF